MKFKKARGSQPLQPGDRVFLIAGPWQGYAGTYVGPMETPVGTMYEVKLDNGCSAGARLHWLQRA
jgi:hypothetical protein